MQTKSIVSSLLCLAALTLLSGCETTTSGGAVGAQRKQLLLISSQELNQVAAQSCAKLKADAAAKGQLNQDRTLLQRVTTIAGRLEPQIRTFRPDAPGWPWEVNLITSPQVNAFCMPGGKISGAADVANIGYEALIATRFSRNDESEADRIGLELAARAGYDPHAGVTVWQKVAAASAGGRPPEFLSTHPTDSSRTQTLQALMPTVTPLYVAARRR